MNVAKLERNIIEMLKEQQVKIGYRSETVRLYYPLLSLNRLLEVQLDATKMQTALQRFVKEVEKDLGEIEISHKNERFCFAIPPQGSDYVHAHMDGTEFICDFIRTIGRHGCTIDEVLQQFYRHSTQVHVEKIEDGEFDYMVCFEDGMPDDFRYCLKNEGGHVIYHRFTVEDYEDFYF